MAGETKKERRGQPPVLRYDRIPQDGELKTWQAHAETLFEFLIYPREWHELEEWRKTQKWSGTLLRNALAWLDNQGLAYSWWKVKRVPIWARVGWKVNPNPTITLPDEERIEEEPDGDPLDDAISLDEAGL